MAIRCGNCGSHYTQTEVATRPPPRYPWALTVGGERVIAELERVGGTSPPCPGCGQRTLVQR